MAQISGWKKPEGMVKKQWHLWLVCECEDRTINRQYLVDSYLELIKILSKSAYPPIFYNIDEDKPLVSNWLK